MARAIVEKKAEYYFLSTTWMYKNKVLFRW